MLTPGGPITILLLCLGCLQYSASQGSCPRRQTTKLVITSTKNRTGQWNSKISIENGDAYCTTTGDGVLGPDHWKVEVDHHAGGCGSRESFAAVITLPPAPAGPGYELFENIGYYKFHTTLKVWQEAVNDCEREGAHLAIINSQEEAEVLRKLINRHGLLPGSKYGQPYAAIGFHDRYKEGEYLTIYDEPLSTTGYVRWSTLYNQPDNWQGSDTNPGEDCGSIALDGGLNDIICTWPVPYICEREL